MEINGEEIGLGEYRQVNLNIARLPSRTEIATPVDIFRSEKEGPCILVMAGLHGDELNGIEAIRRMKADNMLMPLKGTVISIPVLNVYGFLNFSRDVPDGKDVNRNFPGNLKGSLASRVAYHFMNEVFPYIDFGVDLHTGGASRTNYPQIRCKIDSLNNLELAKAFGPPFILNSKLRDRSFRKEADDLGKPILVYEGGESLRFDEHAITEAINGIQRLMHYCGMTDKSEPPPDKVRVIDRTVWVRARYSGMFRYSVKCGQKVTKKQTLASISDPFGDFDYQITAPHDGHIIGINNLPIVNQGDALINIGFG